MVMRRIAVFAVAALFAFPAAVQASFPGDNGKIAFDRVIASDRIDIFSVDPGGTRLSNITNGRGGGIFRRPAWSPNGTKIAFRCGGICLIDEDGGNFDSYSLFGTGFPADDPAWSPDGETIAFSRGTTTSCPLPASCGDELYTIRIDGTGLTRLTDHPGFDYQPDWSPDGSKIAFTRRECGSCEDHIYLVNPDGTGLVRLTAPGRYHSHPSWSPDGSRIAYAGHRPGAFDSEIYTMKSDGSDHRRVTFSGAAFIIAVEPAWSPDGTRIAFNWHPPGTCHDTDCGYEIFTVKPDGTDIARVTNDRAQDADPDWQPIPNRPPDCSGVASSRTVLAPANRQLVPVTVDGVTDPDGDAVSLSVDGVTQDEPVRGRGDPTAPDAVDLGAGELRVRAERSPRGDGRVYRIAFVATDSEGASCTGVATVTVPRHRGVPAVDSAPPSYGSFGT